MIARTMPQAESWYYQANNCIEENDNLRLALAKTDLREMKYLDQLKKKDQIIEIKDSQIDDLEKWYNNKYLWLGLGVLITGGIVMVTK